MKIVSYSKIKHTPRVPLILVTVEKIERENFDLFFFLSSFFLFPRAQLKKYTMYTNDLHTKPLLYYQTLFFSWLDQHASQDQ